MNLIQDFFFGIIAAILFVIVVFLSPLWVPIICLIGMGQAFRRNFSK